MNVRTIVLILGLFSLLSTATGGYLYYHSARESAIIETERELIGVSDELTNNVLDLISVNRNEVRVLAQFEQLQEALLNEDQDALLQANRILDHFNQGFGYDVCYLMNSSGNTIASSNRSQSDSFVGHNYSFRPYFAEAIQGAPSTYWALGITSGARGIYFSHPVYHTGDGSPIGVAVIKVSTRDLDRLLKGRRSGIDLLVNSNGMIFASSREDWNLNLLWRVMPEELSQIAATDQFGKGPWNWTGLERKADDQVVDSSGEAYLIQETSLEKCPGWKL